MTLTASRSNLSFLPAISNLVILVEIPVWGVSFFLSLLRMDVNYTPSSNMTMKMSSDMFLMKKITDEQMPTLERFNESFVKKAEAMQKIALIKLDEGNSGGKVIVKDRSKRTNISGYFKGFLQVKRVNTESDLCEKLISVLKDVFKNTRLCYLNQFKKVELIRYLRFLVVLITVITQMTHPLC
ncbi:hypothetical protein O5479_17775 [Escherichia coli]|nr:hypothetical protein [Escherichia coli]